MAVIILILADFAFLSLAAIPCSLGFLVFCMRPLHAVLRSQPITYPEHGPGHVALEPVNPVLPRVLHDVVLSLFESNLVCPRPGGPFELSRRGTRGPIVIIAEVQTDDDYAASLSLLDIMTVNMPTMCDLVHEGLG